MIDLQYIWDRTAFYAELIKNDIDDFFFIGQIRGGSSRGRALIECLENMRWSGEIDDIMDTFDQIYDYTIDLPKEVMPTPGLIRLFIAATEDESVLEAYGSKVLWDSYLKINPQPPHPLNAS